MKYGEVKVGEEYLTSAWTTEPAWGWSRRALVIGAWPMDGIYIARMLNEVSGAFLEEGQRIALDVDVGVGLPSVPRALYHARFDASSLVCLWTKRDEAFKAELEKAEEAVRKAKRRV